MVECIENGFSVVLELLLRGFRNSRQRGVDFSDVNPLVVQLKLRPDQQNFSGQKRTDETKAWVPELSTDSKCVSLRRNSSSPRNCFKATLVLHGEMLRGDRSALALVCFMAVYWTARIFVDAFYFSHDDWPQGRWFVFGHILLTSLFTGLALSYWGLLVWQVWLRAKIR